MTASRSALPPEAGAANEPGSGARDKPEALFVIGCPRSGTTWVTLLLAQHPEVAAFQHSKFFHYLSALEHWRLRREKGLRSVLVVHDRDSERPAGDESVGFYEPLAEQNLYELCGSVATAVLAAVADPKSGARVVVDQTPENTHIVDFILRVLPEARFLHVIRDPRSVYCSLRSAGRSWARNEFPTRPVDGAKFWSREVEAALAVADLTDRYESVHYEQLIDDGPARLGALFDWLGLPATPALCTAAFEACKIDNVRDRMNNLRMPKGFFRKGIKDSWKSELSTADVRVIEHLAAGLMTRLGYDRTLAPSPRTRWRIRTRETLDRVACGLNRFSVRAANALLRRWLGRSESMPEWTLY